MIISLSLAIAMHATPAKVAPTFQLSYEADLVGFNPDDENSPVTHSTVRYETIPGSNWSRYVKTTDGTKSIMQYLNDRFLVETIKPNGARYSKELPAKEFAEEFKSSLSSQGIVLDDHLKMNAPKKQNVFKRIVGVKCQKSVVQLHMDDSDVEIVMFQPVDLKTSKILGQFETYVYLVEGDTRTLRSAETVVAFRPAKPNHR